MSEKNNDVFCALDLEMNQPSGKIIQIGAVFGNIKTGTIIDRLSLFVNPDERLNPAIIELTKINQKDVDGGYLLEDAYRKLEKMHKNYGAFVNPITWGGGDSQELMRQLHAENPHFEGWCFGRRWIDAKTIYIFHKLSSNEKIYGGLKKACKNLGIIFEGTAHRADWDALNTFKLFKKLLDNN